jgi:hypothetical protein
MLVGRSQKAQRKWQKKREGIEMQVGGPVAEVEADEALETARGDLTKKRKKQAVRRRVKNMGSVHRRAVSPEEFAKRRSLH